MIKAIFLRKVATIVACLAVMMMTACGGGNSNKQGDVKKTDVEAAQELITKSEVKEVTEANYQSYIKDGYGVNAAAPAGWKFYRVHAYGFSTDNENVTVTYQTGDGAAKVADIAKALFEQTKALGGNFAIEVDNNSTKPKKGKSYTSFDELFTPNGLYDGVTSIDEFWYYNGKNGIIQSVSVSADKGVVNIKFEKTPYKL
jgi:hypothetical protein